MRLLRSRNRFVSCLRKSVVDGDLLATGDAVAFAVRADHGEAAEAVEDVAVALAVSTEFGFTL